MLGNLLKTLREYSLWGREEVGALEYLWFQCGPTTFVAKYFHCIKKTLFQGSIGQLFKVLPRNIFRHKSLDISFNMFQSAVIVLSTFFPLLLMHRVPFLDKMRNLNHRNKQRIEKISAVVLLKPWLKSATVVLFFSSSCRLVFDIWNYKFYDFLLLICFAVVAACYSNEQRSGKWNLKSPEMAQSTIFYCSLRRHNVNKQLSVFAYLSFRVTLRTLFGSKSQ